MNNLTTSAYSPLEERLNGLTHGVGFLLAIVGLVMLQLKAEGPVAIASTLIYGISLLLVFLSSTLYHTIASPTAKPILKMLDHSAIYLLIAGTYTPFLLVSLNGWLSSLGITLIWGLALVGLLLKWFAGKRFAKISVAFYLLMGWMAIFFIYPLYQAVPTNGLWLLLAGGICFSIGVIFYVAKQIQYTHAIWHCFVMAGCACHFFSIYSFVI
ncbi:hemolysin III family protein [Pleionea sp. CnH1-48]|uniref:PAQR family membrane homeostasis protein TrhA n=1 Tax=Pleionea sp. CnH1-48 TaxID=2954494 RepID=UPI00209759E9|nr:hemolysin III family protein [Pleionea sp. CnH1-48]MCO7223544.1 hemolysin III family protein [Pleionea sp. CnH1-48]